MLRVIDISIKVKLNIRIMKNKIIFLLFIAILSSFIGCEKETVFVAYELHLRPGSDQGKDAFIYDIEPDRNFGDHMDFMATAWTNEGTRVIARSLIEFDLSSIPSTARIDSARLSLYAYNSPANGTHSNLSGYNACVIQRLLSPWEESSVTWENQPAATYSNQVYLSGSNTDVQHYPDINITNLTKDMIKYPDANFGLLFRLDYEDPYVQMVFASSDNVNSNLHPKLDVYYSIEK